MKAILFANSLAIAVGVFYIFLVGLSFVIPSAFDSLHDSQFLGTEISFLIPANLTFARFLINLVFVFIIVWVFGLVWAEVYNFLRRKKQ